MKNGFQTGIADHSLDIRSGVPSDKGYDYNYNCPFWEDGQAGSSTWGTCTVNNILMDEYDMAAQLLGENWRMPNNADFNNLLSNTTKIWTTINGVKGWKFTGTGNYSDRFIFLPAGGAVPLAHRARHSARRLHAPRLPQKTRARHCRRGHRRHEGAGACRHREGARRTPCLHLPEMGSPERSASHPLLRAQLRGQP